jgi:Protein of unknown function (DUF2490)
MPPLLPSAVFWLSDVRLAGYPRERVPQLQRLREFLKVAVVTVLLLTGQQAQADVEPPPRPRPPEDGVWTQLTVVKRTEPVSVSLQLGYLGGNRIGYVAVQAEHPVTPRLAVSAAYARGGLRIDDGPDLGLNLVRIGATWTNRRHPVEIDARLWGELLIPERGSVTRQVRLRLRATVDLPNVLPSINPRLFIADEIFVTTADGFTRNRVSAGLRTRPAQSLFVDIAYQRSDDTNGRNQNVALLQVTRVF